MDSVFSIIDFYDELKFKYRDYLKKEIVSIIMMQTEDSVYLESTEIKIVEAGFEKQIVRRINLDSITESYEGEEVDFFSTDDKIEDNVKKFIDDFSPYSIINTTDIFNEKSVEKIGKMYNTFNVDK